MASDLKALFGSIDSYKEDLMEFVPAGAGLIGGNIAFGYAAAFAAEKVEFVRSNPWILDVAAIVAGITAGNMLNRYDKRVATGVGIGLVARGLTGLIGKYSPVKLPLAGLGADFNRYLAAAPQSVEQISGAPMSVEMGNGVSGLAGLAATLQ
ncbi:MAG: hypothetical protein Q7R39_00785 [Dehalococcoidia bacterium]|nr:hypothetical protein [Dehalococcoidia bacterium]